MPVLVPSINKLGNGYIRIGLLRGRPHDCASRLDNQNFILVVALTVA